MTFPCIHCGEVDPEGHRTVTNYRYIRTPANCPGGLQAVHLSFCGDCYNRFVVMSDAGSRSVSDRFDTVVQRHMCFFKDHRGFATMDCAHPDHVVAEVLES